MKNDNLGLLVGLLALTFVCSMIGLLYGGITIKQQAVDRGAARWVVDATTGEKSLEWCACFGNTEKDK